MRVMSVERAETHVVDSSDATKAICGKRLTLPLIAGVGTVTCGLCLEVMSKDTRKDDQ